MADFKDVPTDQLLNFQDFTPVHEASFSNAQLNIDIEKQENFSNDYQTSKDENIKDFQDDIDNKDAQKSIWSAEYYQQLFDVDTKDVTERLIASIIPKHTAVINRIRLKPDLYGPVWVSLTLVFAIAISGNLASYLQHANQQKHWKYNFHLVSYAATAIYMYVGLVPLGLWGALQWGSRGDVSPDDSDTWDKPRVLQLVCVYGYSLAIYVPVCVLWTVPHWWLQWGLVLGAAVLSGFSLVNALAPAFRLSKFYIPLAVVSLCCHLLLAAGFMLFFFHTPTH